jgi:RNA polymerase sigma factor (sigma-70 family)
MEPRQNILVIFSTFLSFDNNAVRGWVTDARLRRNMQKCLALEAQNSESFWTLYWHRLWQQERERLAMSHLSAYLQEVGYWSARKLALNLSNQQAIADFFQIAMTRVQNVLKGFNPELGTGLKSYAGFAFSNAIKDILRQRQQVDICTDWALLHKVSHKRLVESLRSFGISEEIIPSYVLVWQGFKAVYAPNPQTGIRKLDRPDASTLQTIADCYNRDRLSLSSSAVVANPELAKQWLTTCCQAVRAYLYPTIVSASAPKPHAEEGELLDDIADGELDSLLTTAIEREEETARASQRSALDRVLLRALVKLDVQSQRLLQLYYGQGITQQDIAKELDTKQYTVSRRLTSVRQTLLKALVDWSQTELHQSIDTNVISAISILLEEWLQVHYTKQ